MTNAAFPIGCVLDPDALIEMVVGAVGDPAPTVGWVMQTSLSQSWAVALSIGALTAFTVWGREPEQQSTAVILWTGDISRSSSRILREDGSSFQRENGVDFFSEEPGSP